MNFFNELFSNFRAVFRFFKFVFCISTYFVRAISITFIYSDPIERRRELTKNGSRTGRWIVNAFNVELICKGELPENEHSLLIGNHVGFIDIVCLNALTSCVFITSLEMKHTPVLGQIADLGGCAYVNRKNRMSIQDELKDIVDVLKNGFRVMLYAESVASNGEQVLPFKKTLMMAAGLAGKPIRLFVFNFIKVNGGPVKYEHRDSVCWYGDQTFFPAIWRSLKLDSLTCEIEFLPLIYPAPNEDRTALAQRVHAAVSAKYLPFYLGMNSQTQTFANEKMSLV